ncbi:hypothetical protein SAMD00019534_084120, partial [Acytostelium subglobosum LB1]|uniref:hypothetical protein n=1 Tax=Acytostelium subglobosum LB1 TaxID=1410327 RepID=UPI00064493A7
NSRTTVLHLYRQLIYYSKLLPNINDQKTKINEIQTKFRQNKNLTNITEITDCCKDAEKKLKFLKVIAPRAPGQQQGIAGKYTMEDGKLVDSQQKEKEKRMYKDQGIDIMDYRRHLHLLNRQHFGGR